MRIVGHLVRTFTSLCVCVRDVFWNPTSYFLIGMNAIIDIRVS